MEEARAVAVVDEVTDKDEEGTREDEKRLV